MPFCLAHQLYPGLVAVEPWRNRRSFFLSRTSYALWSPSPTNIRLSHRLFTNTSSHLTDSAIGLLSDSSRNPCQRHVPQYRVSRRFNSASSPASPPLPQEATIDGLPSAIVLETDTKKLQDTFAQLPTQPLELFTPLTFTTFFQTLQTSASIALLQPDQSNRLLHLRVVQDHLSQFLRICTLQVHVSRRVLKAEGKFALWSEAKVQLHEVYAPYGDFWEETIRGLKITTEQRWELSIGIRKLQFSLLNVMEDWQGIFRLVQHLKEEAREDVRRTQPELGPEPEDEGDNESVALIPSYEKSVSNTISLAFLEL